MDEKRVDLAEEFLREAVYRSRASQAVSTLLAKTASPELGNCGLGEKAAVALDLSPRGRELFEQIFGAGTERALEHVEPESGMESESGAERPDDRSDAVHSAAGERDLARIQAEMRAWIEAQDALDRKRNHFLKAFRNAHGFDRTKYSPAEVAELDAGLARVNEDENRERRSAAQALLRA